MNMSRLFLILGIALCICAIVVMTGCASTNVTPVGPLFTNKDLPQIEVNPKLLEPCKPTLSLLEVEEPDFNDMRRLIGQHVKDYAECKSKDQGKLDFINSLIQKLPEQVKTNP